MLMFICGVATTVAIGAFGCGMYVLGSKKTTHVKPTEAPDKKKVDELKKFNEGINKVINYSADIAMRGVQER